MIRIALPAALLLAAPAAAQLAPESPAPIQDNSFLVEEAYNQEAGVVQHISTFLRSPGGAWRYTFTQEWPLRGRRHQLSYTLPVEDAGRRPSDGAGVGDLALSYRYQLLGDGASPVGLAPRLGVLLPTGAAAQGRGAGGAGVQLGLPLSIALSGRWVAHSNAGLTYTPSARDELGERTGSTSLNVGQSVIWLAHPALNLMLEALWTREASVIAPGATASSTSLQLSPGIRGAIDLPSGLQIVPGVAIPIEVGPGRRETALFLYLSLEHPFLRH